PAAKALFERYGVHFNEILRDEIVARVDALSLPSYTAFVMPRLEPRYDAGGHIADVDISYPCDLETQMLEYAGHVRVPPSPVGGERPHCRSRPVRPPARGGTRSVLRSPSCATRASRSSI